MTGRNRRLVGIVVAAAAVLFAAGYVVWRIHTITVRGWVGMSYIPMVDTKTSRTASFGRFGPGTIITIYPGSPAERNGLQLGDKVVSIDGKPAVDLKAMEVLARQAKGGDQLLYRVERDKRLVDYRVPLRSPLTSPVFVAHSVTTLAVALTFVITGIFVFWRRPADSRATVFLALTLVAMLSFLTGSVIQVDLQTRGIQGPASPIRDFASPAMMAIFGIFFAPLLLHLSLIFPKDRPVVASRPTLFRWLYGAPIYLSICMLGMVMMSSLPLLLADKRYEPYIDVVIRVIGYGTLALSAASMVPLFRDVRKSGSSKETFIARPIATMNVLLGMIVTTLWLAALGVRESRSATSIIVVTVVLIMVFVGAFAFYPVASIISLYRSYRESGTEERRQVKWPLWGTIVAAGAKILLSVVAISFSLMMLSGYRLPSYTMTVPDGLSKVLYVLIPLSFAFAILKYRLMNIDVIIRRTLLYTILSAVVFLLYGVLVAGVGTLLIRFARVQNTTLVIAATIVVALVAVPLRNRLQQLVDRNLFREKRDYSAALRHIGNAIGGGDVEAFLRDAAEQLQRALQTRFVVIALRREEHFVISAKLGIADEVVERVRIPVGSWGGHAGDPIPQELRRLGAVVAVPVSVHREPLGLIASGSKLSDQAMGEEELEFLAAAASQIALGIENSRLRTEEAEFAQARAIQQVLLPTQFPRVDGFEITGRAQPARSVGGDYFDILALGEGKVGVCIGDVAGKGMPAALLMANLQAAVKATAGPDVGPRQLCENVKRVVGGNLSGGKFISFFYGVIDSAARTISYTNAGHNPPILVRAGGALEQLARGGPTFCRLFRDDPHEQETVALAPGDRLVLFTDGASEARRGEEEFGEERLAAFIAANRTATAAALQEKIVEELTAFTAGNFSDDVTLVVVGVT